MEKQGRSKKPQRGRTAAAAIALVLLSALAVAGVRQADARTTPTPTPTTAPTPAPAPSPGGTSCESAAPRVTAFANADGHTTHYDLLGANGAPKGWEPQPLLGTFVHTVRDGCVVVHFSSHRAIGYGFGDDMTVYQVLLDGVPMIGHTTACSDGSVNISCLIAPGNSPISMHSYDLFREVKAGQHTLRVLYAGCCTGKGAYVGGSVVTVEHA